MKRISRRRFVKLSGATAAVAMGKVSLAKPPDEADVIIIGAGSFGCNTAWHLHERGRQVLVLEAQDKPATQATRAAAGFVARWSAVHVPSWGKTEWDMQGYGLGFYERLAHDCEIDFGYAHCGACYIYLTPKGWEAVQPRAARARSYGTQLEVITEDRAAKLVPLINFSATKGILFDPDSIRLRAGDAIRCAAERLGREGVTFKYNTPVRGFVTMGGRVIGVKTDSGELRAPVIVVAAGAWSRRFLHDLGITCPTQAKADTRYTTASLDLPTTLPLLLYNDQPVFYIRFERNGLLIGGEDSPVDSLNPPIAADIPKDGAYRVREKVRELEPVMPIIKRADVNDVTSAVASYTKDTHFILDEVPGAKGLYVMTGCQEAGITHGPALGKMMAELIIDKHTQINRDSFRLTRFVAGGAEFDGTRVGRKRLIRAAT
jgi:sarcosine oxidase subunit beta